MSLRRFALTVTFAASALLAGWVAARQPLASNLLSSPPVLGGCPMFPADNIWNVPVDTLPVDPSSAAYVSTIGAAARLHADFGSGEWPPGSGSPIGIPYVVVSSTQPPVSINFTAYGGESDPGPYPVPTSAPIEGGPSSSGDRHVLVVRQGECKLYELFYAFPNLNGSWNAGSGAVYTLTLNGPLRPAGWTSADAAGLPILPGLVRYDEVASGEVNHAIRFTVPQTRRAYVWPARHYASSLSGAQYPPMGQRFRLKADFDISGFSPHAQVIARAMQTYGLILADNGSAWYISGAPDPRWDNDVLHELDVIRGSDFEAVDASSLMVDPNSGQVVHFGLAANPAVQSIAPGAVAAYRLSLSSNGHFSDTVTLTGVSPSPSVTLGLSPAVVDTPGEVTLTLTDLHASGSLTSGLFYSVPITATGGGFTRTARIGLLVGGARLYLPIILKVS